LALVELINTIQTHGLNHPEDTNIRIEDTEEKRWETVKKIATALIRAIALDFEYKKKKNHYMNKELGWRNKYKIHLLSRDFNGKKISHRQIYGTALIEDLCDNDLLQKRPTKSRWGDQKVEFRLNPDFLQVSDFLIESVRLFTESQKE